MITEKGTDYIDISFDKADRDGNGYLEPADFEAIVDDVCRAIGRELSSPVVENVRFQYRKLAHRLIERMDTDSDERVSKEEYIAGVHALQDDPAIIACTTAAAAAMFNLVDVDGDGVLSIDEYATAMGATGLTREQIEADFRAADLDQNGMLTLMELSNLLQKTYVG